MAVTEVTAAPERLMYPVLEAAGRLGLGRTTLYELIAAGELETVVVGRRRLVPASSMQAYVDRLCTTQGKQAGR